MRYDNGMLPFYDYYSVGRAYDSLFPITMLGLFIGVINHWGTDMSSESDFDGRYARKVRASLFFGFVFFLVSEVMLFGGFFRAYFDRVFNPSYATGCISIPTGMESIDFSRWPLVGTIVLITSGYFANHAYYVLRIGSHSDFIYNIALAIILAFVFLAIQLFEYNGLALTISDSVYGSFFYLPTGFHGFHVTVGLLFLIMQYGRFIEACPDHIKDLDRESTPRDYFAIYDSGRNTGLCCALIYWHFVDITRIFLFLNVYVYSNDCFASFLAEARALYINMDLVQ